MENRGSKKTERSFDHDFIKNTRNKMCKRTFLEKSGPTLTSFLLPNNISMEEKHAC